MASLRCAHLRQHTGTSHGKTRPLLGIGKDDYLSDMLAQHPTSCDGPFMIGVWWKRKSDLVPKVAAPPMS